MLNLFRRGPLNLNDVLLMVSILFFIPLRRPFLLQFRLS
jgi:hypothetical protein